MGMFLKNNLNLKKIVMLLNFFLLSHAAAGPAAGPLSVSTDNPRYFTDGSGRAVYLTGTHTWNNLVDMGPGDPPPLFDYDAYLDFLVDLNHNFIRGWAWEHTTSTWTNASHVIAPHPWARTGPGNALDGKLKFDLTQFNQEYFDRLRSKVIAAGERGIYISCMLFEGWGLQFNPEPWAGHPFNEANNVNGINGDPDGDGHGIETHTLAIPAVTAIQEEYARKVTNTVNDLDNVLYEITNESGPYSTEWQYHMIQVIKDHEATLEKQHPVGMTFQWQGGSNSDLFDSPADWISPNNEGGYRDNPPAADGSKVIITDTDHLWGIGGDQIWVWKSFLRGLNPIFMDPYDNSITDRTSNALEIRPSLGYTLTYADRMNMKDMTPQNSLSSSDYCLANPAADGAEYLVYLPSGGSATVDLSAASGDLKVEWFNPSDGAAQDGETVTGGAQLNFTAPFNGDAVLYVYGERPGCPDSSYEEYDPDRNVDDMILCQTLDMEKTVLDFTVSMKVGNASGLVLVTLPARDDYKITVENILGLTECMFRIDNEKKVSIPTQSMPAGVYVIKAAGTKRFHGKMINIQ
jgi:hypothetical protein